MDLDVENTMDCDSNMSLTLNNKNPAVEKQLLKIKSIVNVEVRLTTFSVAARDIVCVHVERYLRAKGVFNVPLFLDVFDDIFELCTSLNSCEINESQKFITDNVVSISLMTEDTDCSLISEANCTVNMQTHPLVIHVYRLVSGDEADPTYETIEVSSEVIKGGTRWLLPSTEFDGLWDSLVYDSTVKRDLLNYSESALLFSDYRVSKNIISWNRVIFLHGPPGTGKTSLCRALAHKLAIRLSNRFTSVALIEINTVNLLSKWFSESARLVSQMFQSIFEYLEEPDHLVCLLVDEVESLTAVRNSVAAACEPSDAIRVVNAVLTHLDQLKHHPNVLVMATSNVTGVLDPAFLDRADIRAYIGPPSPIAIYAIYCSCLNELIRVGLIERQKMSLLNYRVLSALQFVENSVTSASLSVWDLAQRSVGLNGRTLRKLPLLAHAFHMNSTKQDKEDKDEESEAKENCNLRTSIHGGSVYSLNAFVAALKLAVGTQFADRRMIEKTMGDSSLGNRVKDNPAGNAGDRPTPVNVV